MKNAEFGVVFFNGKYDDEVVSALENFEDIQFEGDCWDEKSSYQIFSNIEENPDCGMTFSVDKVLNVLDSIVGNGKYEYIFMANDTFISNDDDAIILLCLNHDPTEPIMFYSMDEARKYLKDNYHPTDEELMYVKVPKDFTLIYQYDEGTTFYCKED